MEEEKLAVESGLWNLFRFNPSLLDEGKNPLSIDSGMPKINLQEFFTRENRFRNMNEEWLERAKKESETKFAFLKHLQAFYEK
jgi:pyruvate-ferredoxin/flavodoxin oxidoreductase